MKGVLDSALVHKHSFKWASVSFYKYTVYIVNCKIAVIIHIIYISAITILLNTCFASKLKVF
jgi:hypothetical protein